MTLKFLQESTTDILAKLKTDLSYIDSSIDVDALTEMTTIGLGKQLRSVQKSILEMKTGRYGSWLSDERYVRNVLVEETIKVLLESKRSDMATQKLIPGSTYYTGVSCFGTMLEGRSATYLGEEFTGWMKFRQPVGVAKALQVMRHGTEDDFQTIYVGMADGRVDALSDITINHITESSSAAIADIESYCDSRWTGPWPWEIEAPEKLKHMIESREDKHMKRTQEMQRRFARLLREFDEKNMNQFEMVTAAQDMMTQVDSMISSLGKLSSSGIEVMAQAKSTGDDHLVEPMQDALGEPLNNAVTALTDLKAALARATDDLTGNGSSIGDDHHDHMNHDDMGSPMDAMGNNPMGDDAIDNIPIGGDEDERPRKDM